MVCYLELLCINCGCRWIVHRVKVYLGEGNRCVSGLARGL